MASESRKPLDSFVDCSPTLLMSLLTTPQLDVSWQRQSDDLLAKIRKMDMAEFKAMFPLRNKRDHQCSPSLYCQSYFSAKGQQKAFLISLLNHLLDVTTFEANVTQGFKYLHTPM